MYLLSVSLESFLPECDFVIATAHCQYTTTQTLIHSPYSIWERLWFQELFLPWLTWRIGIPIYGAKAMSRTQSVCLCKVSSSIVMNTAVPGCYSNHMFIY